MGLASLSASLSASLPSSCKGRPVDDSKPKRGKPTLRPALRSSSRRRNQANPASTPASALRQEYNVDHSCSTPLERLARDVGNALRAWHVHDGCDRHVPLDWAERMEAVERCREENEAEEEGRYGKVVAVRHNDEGDGDGDGGKGSVEALWQGDAFVPDVSALGTSMDTSDNSLPADDGSPTGRHMSMDLCERGFAGRGDRTGPLLEQGRDGRGGVPSGITVIRMSPSPSRSLPLAEDSAEGGVRSHFGARPIRSRKIAFRTVGHCLRRDGERESSATWERRQYAVPVVLTLWDAPRFAAAALDDGIADERPKFKDEGKSMACDDSEMRDVGLGDEIPQSLRPKIPPSAHSLLGELGFISRHVAERPSHGNGFMSNLKMGLTQDLSTLFNIGQHITLCLDPSEFSAQNTPGKQGGVDDLYHDTYAYIESLIHEVVEAQSQAAQARRRRLRESYRLLRKQPKGKKLGGGPDSNPHDDNSDDGIVYPPKDAVSRSQSCGMEVDEEIVFNHNSCVNIDHGTRAVDLDRKYSGYNSDSSGNDDDESDDVCSDSLSSLENGCLFLKKRQIHSEVVASLSGIFQAALNLAASENNCFIPVIGFWGHYFGDEDSAECKEGGSCIFGEGNLPSWILAGPEEDFAREEARDYGSDEPKENCEEDSRRRLLLSSPIISGTCRSASFCSSHRAYFVPKQVLPLHLSTLNGLAHVLSAQCPPSCGGGVVLAAARHCYRWSRSEGKGQAEKNWRRAGDGIDQRKLNSVEEYRGQCCRRAVLVIERASSPRADSPTPIWGPSEGNPLVALSSSVSWGAIPAGDGAGPLPPLLRLPLRIRSSNFGSSRSEFLEMEDALRGAALDPIGTGITGGAAGGREFGLREPIFMALAEFDMGTPCATLSANTRCVLAALLRCGSLGLDVLPGHLTKKEILAKLGWQGVSTATDHQTSGESKEGEEDANDPEKMLNRALDLARVGSVTRRLVQALGDDVEVDISAAELDRAITDALQRVQSTTFPAPPESVFADIDGDASNSSVQHGSMGQRRMSPRSKGIPPGRLLSILFAHMARLRAPPQMMRLWLSFVEELRVRWDNNESLPNLGCIPGLDNDIGEQPSWGVQRADARVLGHRADHAAFVNSSEPDPDRNQCIVNQKLQVYNICCECKMSIEALHKKRMQHKNEDDNSMMDSEASLWEGMQSSDDEDEFFDPNEEEVVPFDTSPKKRKGIIEDMLMQKALSSPRHNRIGARCPVPHGLPLIVSGDQLYAPYLQRTMPMTDEEEEKQKNFVGVSRSGERPSIRSRIMIAQRLQKPKLISDMSSFKAANPGAVFEDFVRWYGNPENPLGEDSNGQTAHLAYVRRSGLSPEEARTLVLEEASEAIAILMSLRAFWEDTWEEAEPCPAFEQEPLFDPYSTVEMVLHSFETIHPALLMNQVLAAKLSDAKFVLECAAQPAMEVRTVKLGLASLKATVDAALEALAKDSADGFFHLAPKMMADSSDPLVYISTMTISMCDEACDNIGEMEVLLSRTLSLLCIFPGDCAMVDTLLQCKHGQSICLKCPIERSAFLGAIKRQQIMMVDTGDHSPTEASPSMQEYVLHSIDPLNPCQLSARLTRNSFEEDRLDTAFEASLLLAVSVVQSSSMDTHR